MTHRKAVLGMIVVTLMWSVAGVVTRHLEEARSFEITFWRSFFNAVALALALRWMRGPGLWRGIARSPWTVWVSGLCWAVMFTAFMVALTLTSVANVLITMAIGPLLTALFAWGVLGQRLAPRTWLAIATAGVGIAWMFGRAALTDGMSLSGALVALCVPLAAAVNWTVLQHVAHGVRRNGTGPKPRSGVEAGLATNAGAAAGTAAGLDPVDASRARGAETPGADMLPAVLIGAALSALATLPAAWPLQASPHDLQLLALLGVFQLAVPCLLVVRLARALPAAEIALLGLLEVVMGVAWAWIGAGEAPGSAALAGGLLVIGALAANEALALRRHRRFVN